ncbi:unnamed protein product [Prunus armeniaca]
MDKSSPAGDASVSDLLKTNLLSSSSACFRLAAEEVVAEKDEAVEDATDEVVADVASQAGGATKSAVDQADAEEVVD